MVKLARNKILWGGKLVNFKKKHKLFVILLLLFIIIWQTRYMQLNRNHNFFQIQNYSMDIGKTVNTGNFTLHVNNIKKTIEKDEFGRIVYLYTINLDMKNNSTAKVDFFPHLYINAHLKGTNMTNGLHLDSGEIVYNFEPNRVYSGKIKLNLPKSWGVNDNTHTSMTYVSNTTKKNIKKYNLILN